MFGVLGLALLAIAAAIALLAGGALRGLELGVLFLLQLVLEGLAYLAVAIFFVLYTIISWLPLSLPALHIEDVLRQLLSLSRQLPTGSGRPLSLPSVPAPLLAGVALPAALVLVAGLARLRARPAGDAAADEERELVWSWSAWWRQLLAALRSLGRRRAAPAQAASPGPAAPSPDSVRALYRAVLRWCRTRGRARLATETPAEFEPALRVHVPADLSNELTAAYVRTRYGGHGVSEAEIARLAAHWQELQGGTTEADQRR